MNKTAKTIVTFEVRVFEPCMQQMSEIIVQSAKLVLEAVPLLSSIGTNAGRLNALTTKIINVEEEADEVWLVPRKYSSARPKPMRLPGKCWSPSAAPLSRRSDRTDIQDLISSMDDASSNLVGCSTGMSAILMPRRSLAACWARSS